MTDVGEGDIERVLASGRQIEKGSQNLVMEGKAEME